MTSPFDGLPDIFIGTFGQAVTLYVDENSAVETTGIFRSPAVDALGVVQPGATLHLKKSDADLITDDSKVVVDGVTYRARVEEPDGKGMVPVRLEIDYGS